MRIVRLLVLVLPLVFQGGVAAAAERGPALWALSDQDTTIYLFGTIHLLPREQDWFDGPVRDAFARADTLIVETLPPEDPKKLAAAMSLGYSDDLPPVLDRVGPADRPKLEAALRDIGVAAPGSAPLGLRRMETWTLQLMLTSARLIQLGFSVTEGVDRQLITLADDDDKAVLGFESFAEQLALLDTLAESDQRAMLSATLDGWDGMASELDRMVASWMDGDEGDLARIITDSTGSTPALSKLLLTDRNASWAAWIEKRMADPGVIFVAVGAGHLAGRDSLQSMLSADGFKVRRLR